MVTFQGMSVGSIEIGQADEVGKGVPFKKHSTFQNPETRNIILFFLSSDHS